MKRVLLGAAVVLTVLVGGLNVQQVVSADPAIVIKNDGECGQPGSDENGDIIFGGVGVRITEIENGNKVTLKCKGADITNQSGVAQVFTGFGCGIFTPGGALVEATETHASVSPNGIGTMTCIYTKSLDEPMRDQGPPGPYPSL